jgi:predicted branched-subunit amino acid permease
MFGGSAHLAAISLLDSGAGMLTVLITVIVINARLLVYSASIGSRLRYQPRWFRWVAPYFLVDQMFALTFKRLDTGVSAGWLRWYYLTAGLALGAVWLPAIAVGVVAGPVIPESWHLSYAMPVMLIGLLAPSLVNRPAWIAAGVGASVAVLLIGMPHGLHLLIATAAGASAGIAAERFSK